jgi:hypothetical protein
VWFYKILLYFIPKAEFIYFMEKFFVVFFLYFSCFSLSATTWQIGPTRTYTMPSQVRLLVSDGDIIEIDGGVYLNDYTKWTKNNLKIIGLGNSINPTILRSGMDIPNGKGIFVFELPGVSDNPTIENITFDGAQVSDNDGGNGAGIRFQAANLTLKNCRFINCQNGILEGNFTVNNSTVVIENCEFFNNGYQIADDPEFSGYEHHIYISASTMVLKVQNCYFHRPRGQANSIKTRAQSSYILYNLIDEETEGYGSWEINLAQGGRNIIMGNIIIQAENGANHGLISYDNVSNALQEFYFVNNTVINKWPGTVRYFTISPSSGINIFDVKNNIFASNSSASSVNYAGNVPSALSEAGNLFSDNYSNLGFMDPSSNNYQLTTTAIEAIDRGVSVGNTVNNFPLIANKTYSSFNSSLSSRSIEGTSIDIGAFELANGPLPIKLLFFKGNQKNNIVELQWKVDLDASITSIEIDKSIDNQQFKTIKRFNNDFNLSADINSSFKDYEVAGSNIYYYRIKLIDQIGKVILSNTITVLLKSSLNNAIWPNPVSSYFEIAIIEQPLRIEMFDNKGQLVKKINEPQLNKSISIENLTPGTYTIISTDKDQVQNVFKIVKN